MKIAVVAASYGDDWREEDLLCRRTAAALATRADVDLLLASGSESGEDADGALRIRRFAATVHSAGWRRVVERATVGPAEGEEALGCSCPVPLANRIGADLPDLLQEEIARVEGGHSPELYDALRADGYDLVLFAGYRFASTCFGVQAVGPGARVALLAMARDEPLLRFRAYRPLWERVQRVLVVSEHERELVRRRLGHRDVPVHDVGFALRVHPLAAETEPAGWSGEPGLVIARDWTRPAAVGRWLRVAERVARELPGVRVCLLGRGSEGLPPQASALVPLAASRLDLWRWVSRSLALIDPEPHRLLAREVLEAMMYGVPVIVADRGGASREHAERANGGLWFRDEAELVGCAARLLDAEVRRQLGGQGRAYADARYGDADAFVEAVWRAVA
ncbi:MAG: hypothetical protein QOD06_3236 [Candidatus Binatota bacterium]|nr:hypothetical protein [Candidatus Binatota bacterium]